MCQLIQYPQRKLSGLSVTVGNMVTPVWLTRVFRNAFPIVKAICSAQKSIAATTTTSNAVRKTTQEPLNCLQYESLLYFRSPKQDFPEMVLRASETV